MLTVAPFWVTAARQLIFNGAGVLWSRGVTGNNALVDHLLKTELTALSVRAMLTTNPSALEFLPDTGAPCSIRDWIDQDDGGGFLFLSSRGN